MGKVLAIIIAVFLSLAAMGGGMGAKLDSDRPRDRSAFSYYSERLTASDGAEREKIALAIEWADLAGDLTEDEYNALQAIYREVTP